MPSPRFSIILPTYRVEKFITDCLASLACQTFTDFEILIMDGQSSDRTVELARAMATNFAGRLTVRSEQDAGVYDAMNKGIQAAQGDWLYFLGADDWLHDAHVLGKIAAHLAEYPADDLVYGDVLLQSDGSRYAGAFNLDRLLLEKNLCHQAVFYKRSVFEKIGRYNLRYKVWADWDFNIRCFQNPDFQTRHLDFVIADYNNQTGLSSRHDDQELRKFLPVCVRSDTSIRYLLARKLINLLQRLTGR